MVDLETLVEGTKVIVRVADEFVEATFIQMNEKYGLPLVELAGGNKVLRKVHRVVGETTTDEEVVPPQPEATRTFNINVRFDFLRRFVKLVAKGSSNSLIISGSGGLGKSFTVKQTLAQCGLVEGEHYVVVKGFATPKSLYRQLHEANDMLVIFDDCDSVLRDEKAVNILKAALDTDPVRTISWLTEATDEDLPNQFEFTGKVIFLTNLDKSRVPQPMVSRSQIVDVAMTNDEKIERMRSIIAEVRPDIDMATKLEVVDTLNVYRHRCKDLNFRTLLKALDIRMGEPEHWTELVEYSMTVM